MMANVNSKRKVWKLRLRVHNCHNQPLTSDSEKIWMPSIRQFTNDCLPLKIFVFSHYGLKIRALKRWCVFKSVQCMAVTFALNSTLFIAKGLWIEFCFNGSRHKRDTDNLKNVNCWRCLRIINHNVIKPSFHWKQNAIWNLWAICMHVLKTIKHFYFL